MSDTSQGPGWWLASDGKWYPPLDAAPAPGWWLASDGQWYPPTQQSAAAQPPEDRSASPAASSAEPEPDAHPVAEPAKPVKPVAAKPVKAVKPVAAKPAAQKPVAQKPAAAKPVKPAAAKPAAAKPVAAKSAPAKPAAAKPVAQQPVTAPAPTTTPSEAPASTARPAFRRTPADPDVQIRKQNEQSRQTNAAMAAARAAAATRALKHLEGQIQEDLKAAHASPTEPDTTAPVAAEAPSTSTPVPPAPTAPVATQSPDEPILEVKGSALASDIENIGERLALFHDRVELRDRTGKPKQIIYGADIADVVVHKKLAGCTVTIESGTGTTITAKGLKPEQAEEIRAIVLKHTRQAPRPEGVPAPVAAATLPTAPSLGPSHPTVSPLDEVVMAQKLNDLHRVGLLSDVELADKMELLRALARGDATVSTGA